MDYRPVFWGTWVPHSVKHPTLDFGLGHDLPVCKTKPHSELIADSFSLSLNQMGKVKKKKKKKQGVSFCISFRRLLAGEQAID